MFLMGENPPESSEPSSAPPTLPTASLRFLWLPPTTERGCEGAVAGMGEVMLAEEGGGDGEKVWLVAGGLEILILESYMIKRVKVCSLYI